MKNLFLVRHAKSSWKEPGLKDFDRPLNKRGKENLKMMSKYFAENFSKPDLILSSPAKSARTTAEGFCKELNYPSDKIRFLDELYMASASDLIKIISAITNYIHSIIIIAHNFGLTDFVNLKGDKYIENIPTCGIVELKTEFSWDEISVNNFRTINFIYPKMFD